MEAFKVGVEFTEEYAIGFNDCYIECIKNNLGVAID